MVGGVVPNYIKQYFGLSQKRVPKRNRQFWVVGKLCWMGGDSYEKPLLYSTVSEGKRVAIKYKNNFPCHPPKLDLSTSLTYFLVSKKTTDSSRCIRNVLHNGGLWCHLSCCFPTVAINFKSSVTLPPPPLLKTTKNTDLTCFISFNFITNGQFSKKWYEW